MKDLKDAAISPGLAGFTVMRGAALVCVLLARLDARRHLLERHARHDLGVLHRSPAQHDERRRHLARIVGTFLLAAGALVIALPLGVMSAVFLNEYNLDSPVITVIRLSIANLAGVPSIIFGLFGLTFFVVFCGFGVSLLSASSRLPC